jgi:hypothetical protein
VIVRYDPQQHRSAARYGVDFGVVSRGLAAQALWLLILRRRCSTWMTHGRWRNSSLTCRA